PLSSRAWSTDCESPSVSNVMCSFQLAIYATARAQNARVEAGSERPAWKGKLWKRPKRSRGSILPVHAAKRFDGGEMGPAAPKVNQMLRRSVIPLHPRSSLQAQVLLATSRSVLRSATFSPLAHRAFALILAGSLVANFGNQIQAVGAAWLLTENGAPADVIALAQTATNLPIMLLALPAGAWADMFDRRGIMLAALAAMLVPSLGLAGLALASHTPAAAVIGLTALLACGIACFAPAMAGSIGGVVPRTELAAAVALNIV